ncbi:MAG: protein kinase domain-containing protein [Terriglobales bacterium]
MQTDRWQEIEQLCHEALERAEDERGAYLESACAGDEALLREVQSLLAHQKQADKFIETPALDHAAKALADSGEGTAPRLVGRVVSHYRIVERLGYGGMGEVYRAVRADDQYQKWVALKLVRADFGAQFILERFKNERQILAGLEHPNIARLIDGGTTEEGLPYFVLELVEGEPIDRYCDSHRLSTVQRLELFRSVCSAVHYAHQHLVVHRDIKPGNILVTAEGAPKLLDFGIAKITDPTNFPRAIEPTATAMRVMTPEYASPEQIRGEAITTTSDIYSLGVLLYYILTGHLPYKLTTRAPHEIALAICELDPEKPSTAVSRVENVPGPEGPPVRLTPELISSTREGQPEKLRRRLRGDLDQIVLKAIRKEPDRRYSSAEQLSEDVGRYLDGRTVLARKSTLGYRAAKFVKRHKIGVIATAFVVLLLVAGAAAIVRESRLERVQRERAERRFNDVRKLSNSLFDIHDDIANLPGTVAARKKIVGTSLNYLDSLATEASGDASLQEELAAAYERVADIQGRPGTENLGDTAGALASYRKGEAISQALVNANPRDSGYKFTLGGFHLRLGHLLGATGDYRKAMEEDRKALDIFGELTRADPSSVRLQNVFAIGYLNLAQHQDVTGDFEGSIGNFGKAAEIYARTRESSDARRAHNGLYNLGVTYVWLAQALRDEGDYSKSLEYAGKSLEIRKTVLSWSAKNVRAQLDLADSYTQLGEALWRKGDFCPGGDGRAPVTSNCGSSGGGRSQRPPREGMLSGRLLCAGRGLAPAREFLSSPRTWAADYKDRCEPECR